MPRFHTPQHAEDFVVNEHVTVMDTDGVPFQTVVLPSVPGESVFDLLDRAAKKLPDSLEVIDYADGMDRPVIVAREI